MAPPRPTTFGAWVDARRAHFRLWAPSAARVELVLEGFDQPIPMTPAGDGTFTIEVDGPSHGRRYGYRVDGRGPFPDPASRWQPDGAHGESALDDPRSFGWRAAPVAIDRGRLVIYELHVGTFTPGGTFDSARDRLAYLRDLGITAIELMPIAEFAGSRNWGYDGVALFAASSAYGGPAALRRFVDEAHALGLSVILDVVYNHLGPDGAYLNEISPEFFASGEPSPWGDAVNLADPIVREWLTANAVHWTRDFRIDGLRLDATHALPRAEAPGFLRQLGIDVRAACGRDIVFIAEDHRKLPEMLRPASEDGWGLDGVWADDFHHHVRVITAGDSHGYYATFRAAIDDLAETIRHGWFRAGDIRPRNRARFVYCIQNHDQIGNRARGDRLHHAVPLDVWRAASALLLLAPATPLLFMGQEWAATSPFQYFTDHHDGLGALVREGRRGEFRDFPEFRESPESIPDPQSEETFTRSRLRWEERRQPPHAGVLELYRTLLRLRQSERLLQPGVLVLDPRTIALISASAALVVNLAGAREVPFTERVDGQWRVELTTEDAPFAEHGTPPRLDSGALTFATPAAVFLTRG